jgi:hypothetical protein
LKCFYKNCYVVHHSLQGSSSKQRERKNKIFIIFNSYVCNQNGKFLSRWIEIHKKKTVKWKFLFVFSFIQCHRYRCRFVNFLWLSNKSLYVFLRLENWQHEKYCVHSRQKRRIFFSFFYMFCVYVIRGNLRINKNKYKT